MELDLEQIAILLQRRYGLLREIRRLTEEMQEAVRRQDQVSFDLLLNMRGEEIAKYDVGREELWSQAEKGREALSALRYLLNTDPDVVKDAKDPMEAKIFELRRKNKMLIQEIQMKDKIVGHGLGKK